jgi:hypothetical protein
MNYLNHLVLWNAHNVFQQMPKYGKTFTDIHCAHTAPNYVVIHIYFTYFIKLVHLNGRKKCNMRYTDGKRNSPSCFLNTLLSALYVCSSWCGRRQVDNSFLPIPTAACHDWFLRQKWWSLCSLDRSCGRDCRKARVLNIFPYHHCHLRNWSWNAAAGMDGNGLSAWYLPCHKGWVHTAFMRYAKIQSQLSFFFIWDQVFRSSAVSQPLWLWLISCTSVINDKALYFFHIYLLLKGQVSYFLHISHKRWDVKTVSCIWASAFKSQRKQSLSITKVTPMYAGLYVQCTLFLSDFNQNQSTK